MKRFFFSLAIFANLISACGPATSAAIPDANMAKSNLPREIRPKIPDVSLETLVSGNNMFALDLYRSLSGNEENLVISPYSISTAFAMTYAGTRGETASQIASTLHFDLLEDQLHSTFNALDLALAKQTRVKVEDEDQQSPPQLNVVNTIWAQKNFSFQSLFLDTLGSNYDAGIHLVDFAGQPDSAREEINSSVSRETKGKLKDILSEDDLNRDTRLLLINTVYFESDWSKFFSAIGDSPFYLLDGSQVNVLTMKEDQTYFPYARNQNWLAVELPYAGRTFAMDIIVPNAGEFDEFERKMDYQLISGIISSLQGTSVFLDLRLPEFEFTNDFALADSLKSLGISDAFMPARADFSGMTGTRDLYLSDTFHKTYIAVDPEGTCAAAATGGRFILISGVMDVPTPVDINRPFIFIIRDVKSGQFLFIGRVLDPTQ